MSIDLALWLAIGAGVLAIVYGLAAVRWIVAQPAGNARMQEIADRAGINKALLHYYFRSKDKLFDLVFAQRANAVMQEQPEGGAPEYDAALRPKTLDAS